MASLLKEFTLELREAAMECSNIEYRCLLRGAADELSEKIAHFAAFPCAANMKALNGAWAFADRIYADIPPEAPPAPLAGSPEPARLAA